MDSVVSWFIACVGGLYGVYTVLHVYMEAHPHKEDPFADYNKDKKNPWEKY